MYDTTCAVEIALTFGLLRNGTAGPLIPQRDALDWLARAMADRGQDYFSVTEGTGYYRGQREPSLRLSVIATWKTVALDHAREALNGLAREFAREFDQDSVMLTEVDTQWSFIA